jgi:hypothetical protein
MKYGKNIKKKEEGEEEAFIISKYFKVLISTFQFFNWYF